MVSAGMTLDGRYRLVQELASGGMGTVWEAEQLALGKRVAVKLLHPAVSEVPGIAARFEREARATSELSDPHIVRVIDFGRTSDGLLFLVMDLLDGRTLGDMLDLGEAFTAARAVSIVDQVLSGLETAHARDVVHRDLKPDNVMLVLGKDGEHVQLLDFGIAAVRGDENTTKLTQTGAVMGTPAYMAPEQAMGQPVDARTDLYAVGTILYELLSGEPAYPGVNYNQILHAILLGEPVPLLRLRLGLPPVLYAIVTRAMARSPEDRYDSAADFREALRGVPVAALPPQAQRFHMPSKLVVTDLGSTKPAPPSPEPVWGQPRRRVPTPAPAPPPAFSPEDAPALELDRPPPPDPGPASASHGSSWQSFLPILGVLALLLASLGGYFLRAKKSTANVTIELKMIPRGAKLSLDDTPTDATRLVLPISPEVHTLRVEVAHQAPRLIRFSAQRDQILDVGGR